MAKKGTKGSLLLQIGGAALTGYGIYLLFGKEKSTKMLMERKNQGGGGGGTIASASSGTYYPNVPSPVANYKQGCTDPNYQEYDPTAVDFCTEPVYANGQCFGQTAAYYERQVCETLHIKGCTDPEAENFDQNATTDDGSCEFAETDVLGCTDPSATNYDPNATLDDGSCIAPIAGCTCPAAVNYNPNATIDNGSCKVCTNPSADNFVGQQCTGVALNPDPQSCQIAGCTDPSATNYNPEATYNNGTCVFPDVPTGAVAGSRIPKSGSIEPATAIKIGFDGGGVSLKGYEDALDARRRINNGEFA